MTLQKTFTPPSGFEFDKFRRNEVTGRVIDHATRQRPSPEGHVWQYWVNQDPYVDIWFDLENAILVRQTTAPVQVRPRGGVAQITVMAHFFASQTAAEFPLRCDGNLKPLGQGGSGGPPPEHHWAAVVVGNIELHIDADNNGTPETNWAPDRKPEERAARVDPAKPGKLIAVNDGDSDNDGIPDFADMRHSNRFVRVELDISKVKDAVDVTGKVRFNYFGSDPGKVMIEPISLGSLVVTNYVPQEGHIRLWTKDGTAQRNPASVMDGGDYVPPGVEIEVWRLFKDGATMVPLYVEGILPTKTGPATLAVSFLPRAGYPASEGLRDEARYSVWKISFVYAQGADEGKPMNRIPIFSPCDGVGLGERYTPPEPPLRVEFGGRLKEDEPDVIRVEYFDRTLELLETGETTLIFHSADGTMSVELADVPDFEEWDGLVAQISDTVSGISEAQYWLIRSEANVQKYEAIPPFIEIEAPEWLENECNAIRLWNMRLVETEVGARVFEGEWARAAILNGAAQTPQKDRWRVALTVQELRNAVFEVEETGAETRLFRNTEPPVAVNVPAAEPQDHVIWRVKIEGLRMEDVEGILLETPDDQVVLNDLIGGSILTAAKLVLVPKGTRPEQVPGGIFRLLQIHLSKMGSVSSPGDKIQAQVLFKPHVGIENSKAPKEEKPGIRPASLARSFSEGGWICPPLNSARDIWGEASIASKLRRLSYDVSNLNNHATKQWMLENIKHKSAGLWAGHGTLLGYRVVNWVLAAPLEIEPVGPVYEYRLVTKDDETISAREVEDLKLDVRVQLMLSCWSGWTGGLTRNEAIERDQIHAQVVQPFARAFGPNVAYVGLAWWAFGSVAYEEMKKLLDFGKREPKTGKARTLREMLKVYDRDDNSQMRREFKIWGNIDRAIDAQATNY